MVLFHCTTRYEQKYGFVRPAPFDFAWGESGVQLFFIISGFVIFMCIDAAKRPMDFVVSRLSRLYPLYRVAVTLTWSLLSWAQIPGTVRTVSDYLINLTML